MLDRLLSYVHAALDKAPHQIVALRVSHPDGFRWSVANRTLTAGTEADTSLGTVSLSTITLQALATWLEAQGCQITYVSPELAGRTASTLLSGSGAESQSNGDALHAYDTLLWSILDTYAVELEMAETSIWEAVNQLSLQTAGGEWLDFWGEFFGLRRDARSDADYRQFLIDETLRPRNNPVAIEKAIKDITGKTVSIDEPWRRMFRLDESSLSGAHHLHDYEYYNYFRIQPVSNGAIDWSDVLPVVRRNKPAGVLICDPKTILPGHHLTMTLAATILSANVGRNFSPSIYNDRALLDFSTIEEMSFVNNDIRRRSIIKRSSASQLSARAWPDVAWTGSHWIDLVAVIRSEHERSHHVSYSVGAYRSRTWPRVTWADRGWTDSVSISGQRTGLS